ncbi:ribonuclease HIII [Gracilibacillus sp. YIM 98692]|uniref:ribonuclease HIII n=1 Tax=Gracilibacillus sp. YIM 98692 TaxID=2663532 RepID=UPI0013D34D88|nr:ribonuclease HIII [Gracilibacillus sp. YIM 98692]
MSNVVLQLPKNLLQKLKSHYQSQIHQTPVNTIFQAKANGASITAYSSGKVLFQGKNAAIEADKWKTLALHSNQSQSAKVSVNQHDYQPPKDFFSQSHIGTDEAGTGDYFGPITVGAVYVTDDQIEPLKQLGITDSKTLTDDRITELAKTLVREQIPYTLLTLDNKKYNQLQKKGWSQGKMKAMLHHHAIHKLAKKLGEVKPKGILVDQFCQPSVYQKHIQSEGEGLPENTFFMTKAESYSTAVAAASIIARAKFVKEMDRLSKSVGVTIPKGASNKVDETAAYIIRKFGLNKMNQVAKTHFANTEKAKKLVKK